MSGYGTMIEDKKDKLIRRTAESFLKVAARED
jgi:hypothetical protein